MSRTGTMKLTIRKASNGAISAKETHRRVIGASARNPGVEPLGELIAIFDPEIGIEFERVRSEEHTSELQSLMRISYAVFCLKKKQYKMKHTTHIPQPV